MTDYEELVSAADTLSERVAPCPICGGTQWDALDRPALLPFFAEEENSKVVEVASDGCQVLVYVCARCAHVRFFAVYKLRQLIRAAKGEHAQSNGH